jgi:hypothetical protein
VVAIDYGNPLRATDRVAQAGYEVRAREHRLGSKELSGRLVEQRLDGRGA